MSYVLVKLGGRTSLVVWFVCIVLWLSAAAFLRPLTLPDEGRYVGIAWEMFTSGNWLVPHLDGLPYFHKPPLFYWITAASFSACGPHLICTRMAPLLSGMLMVCALGWFLYRHLGKKMAVTAVLVLLTQPFFFAGAQFANLDMLVASMIAITILCAAEAVWCIEQGQSARRALLLTATFAASGVLAKGLIGMVLPGGVIVLWLWLSRRLALARHLLWWPALALFLLLTAPWFWSMEAAFKGFLDYFFIHHHFQRFAGANFNNQEPFWFYIAALLLLTLPSSLWLFSLRRSKMRLWSARQQDMAMLMVCWTGVIVLFFSIPVSKPLGYIMPVLPPVATLVAMCIRQTWSHAVVKRRYVWATLLLGMLTCLGAITAVIHHAQKVASYQLAMQVQASVQPEDQLVMMSKYQFDLPYYLHLRHPAWIVADWQAAAQEVLDDSWEKELLEATKFDPQTGQRNLLTPAALHQQMCQLRTGQALWVAGDSGSVAWLPALKELVPAARIRDHDLWRLSPAVIAEACRH